MPNRHADVSAAFNEGMARRPCGVAAAIEHLEREGIAFNEGMARRPYGAMTSASTRSTSAVLQ